MKGKKQKMIKKQSDTYKNRHSKIKKILKNTTLQYLAILQNSMSRN